MNEAKVEWFGRQKEKTNVKRSERKAGVKESDCTRQTERCASYDLHGRGMPSYHLSAKRKPNWKMVTSRIVASRATRLWVFDLVTCVARFRYISFHFPLLNLTRPSTTTASYFYSHVRNRPHKTAHDPNSTIIQHHVFGRGPQDPQH